MNILITGISGFLGSYLAEKLSKEHSVIGLYHLNKSNLIADITCFDNLESIKNIPDVIVMCHAAVSSGITNVDKNTLFEVNVDFTKKILQKFLGVKMIYISSVSVFGSKKEIIQENSFTDPQTEYALSKLDAENEVKKNNNTSIIRFSSLYGNGMKENTLIPNYCNQALESQTIKVWGDGSRLQNYIHIDDAVNLIEKVLDHQSEIAFSVLGTYSKEYSNNEVAKIISTLTNARIEYVNQDTSTSFQFDNTMTQKILNWQPKKDLEFGLKNYLEWKKK